MQSIVGKPLSYLIGIETKIDVPDGRVVMVPWDCDDLVEGCITAGYCNHLDEQRSNKYGPYMKQSDTAKKYKEWQPDPNGKGFTKNLVDQFTRRSASQINLVEIDNADSYELMYVFYALDVAERFHLSVLAKNPGEMAGSAMTYIRHPSICGMIVEFGDHDVNSMVSLRRLVGKLHMPIWFVTWGDNQLSWAHEQAEHARIRGYKYVGVTHSGGDEEYSNAHDILLPIV